MASRQLKPNPKSRIARLIEATRARARNIGTATSSAMAAIGASATAKRLALAYVLFKLIAAVIALVLFPFVTPLLNRLSRDIDGVTLLAAYHTAYNILGVAVLLPVIDKFTRFVERILPERGSTLTTCLDPAALANPIVAVEAVRRTVARALAAVCDSIEAALGIAGGDQATRPVKPASLTDAANALRQAQTFMTDVSGPPDSEDQQRRLTCTLHALDHASRLAETASSSAEFRIVNGGPDDTRAVKLCAEAMRHATAVAGEIAARSADGDGTTPVNGLASLTMQNLTQLERNVEALEELRRSHRIATLGAVATGSLTTDEAMVRVDTVRSLEALTRHAWRSSANLVGLDK